MVLENKIFMTPQPIFYLSLLSTLWSRPSGHIFLKNSESPYSKGALRKVWLNLHGQGVLKQIKYEKFKQAMSITMTIIIMIIDINGQIFIRKVHLSL